LACSAAPHSAAPGGGGSRHIDGKLRLARRGLHWPLGVLRRSLFAVLEAFLRAIAPLTILPFVDIAQAFE
jgi:hypothetical protein